jgi:hypothetical protein
MGQFPAACPGKRFDGSASWYMPFMHQENGSEDAFLAIGFINEETNGVCTLEMFDYPA